MDITILSQGAHACSTSWDDPQVALAWVRMLAENITPEGFLSFFKAWGADADQLSNAQHMITYCTGQGV